MKRTHIHALFALTSILLAAFALQQAWQLHTYQSLIKDVKAASVQTDTSQSDSNDKHPAMVLTRGTTLSQLGEFEKAESTYVELIDQQANSPFAQAARFNLGNHYLRHAMNSSLSSSQRQPLLETAKQRYRDLLLNDPMDWDARYNLERALQLAPERSNDSTNKGPPPKSVRVIVPDFEADYLP